MIIVGSASAVGASVAIPAHQVGDLIFVFARRASNTPATIPTAGGTVPTWVTAQSSGGNTHALTAVSAVATATNHTTGTFTNAAHICVLVLRADSGKTLSMGVSSVLFGSNNQSIGYPALTLSTLDGTSHGVRVGSRTVAVAAVGNPPTNWTNQIVQPAGAGALMSVHTRLGLTANPVQDTVTTTSSNAPNRAFTIEVREVTLTAPVNTALPQIFGDAIVGNTLSCGQGTWTSNAGTPTYAYQWYKNDVPISGATSNLYFVVAGDALQLIECRVTATNTIGSTSADTPGVSPGPGPLEDIYDQFTRADGAVYAGAGATLWTVERLDWAQNTLMEVKGNALANPGTSYEQAVTKGVLGPGDWDFVVDCLATAASPGEIAIWFSVSGHGPAAAVNGYAFIGSSLSNYWAIRAYAGGVNQGTLVGPLTHPGGPIVAGDSIWISKRMNTYRVYRKPSGGNWSLVISLTNASYPTGVIAIETSDATVRWDNVRGGPWTGIGPPPTAKVVSIV